MNIEQSTLHILDSTAMTPPTLRPLSREVAIQREGMGILESQTMLSLRDIAHDGVLCTFSNRSVTCSKNEHNSATIFRKLFLAALILACDGIPLESLQH
jgi:hypothetical protein